MSNDTEMQSPMSRSNASTKMTTVWPVEEPRGGMQSHKAQYEILNALASSPWSIVDSEIGSAHACR